MDELIVGSRAVHFVAMALLFGVPLFRLAIAPDGGVPRGRAVEIAAALAALLSGLGWFAGVAVNMAGSWSDAFAPDVLQEITFETRFGHLWVGRLGLLMALLGGQAFAKPSRWRDGALLVLAGGFAASLVGVGHGMTGAGHGPVAARIHMMADMLHLLCAAAWIGGLFCLGPLLHRVVVGSAPLDVAREALRRFSHVGYWVVALVLISGCINALVMVPGPASLIGSDYGRILLLKLALVLALVVTAIVNRLWLTPRIMTAADTIGVARLWRSVVLEQGVAILVLATVAWLGNTHPVP